MRVTQILLPVLIALATAACARQQSTYYAVDPATQQPVGQRYAPTPQPQDAQARYRQAPAASSTRGLFSSPQIAQRSYAQQSYMQSGYGQPAYQPQPQQEPNGRGLFNAFHTRQPNYPQQAYAPQPAHPQYAHGQPSYAPRQQTYARQPAPAQYQQPNYGTGGPYVAARASNPFATARWY